MRYWLFKSEPFTFSIDDLYRRPKKTEAWDGVRNFQARNFLRHEVKQDDVVFFYHSSCEVPGIVGSAVVVKEGYPDKSAFNPDSEYYDPKSTREKPIWYCVDVKFVQQFSRMISLAELRKTPQLKKMIVLRKGNRLSIVPLTNEEGEFILKVALHN